ncbi:HWE histidine kinase domain-containing protein [Amorphus orientalis]|uniref:histidine kinase n=1 Tax=Amorphus orientalis TaxID=649198 RepID=A0AAE3VQU3_9HYPH|nr:HWE histidine kinase domain-containing protein [Amorphus orientalis]MDQ0316478.1 light-regulated signal transduction histidine kinase (bacteriophytochrome)/CheY-like chemotaxis protein [Amorphus orientalis]
MWKRETVDLTNCDREPIHIPGSIQPHGCLVACEAATGTIRRASDNAAEMLGADGSLAGRLLGEVIGEAASALVGEGDVTSTETGRPALAFAVPLADGAPFDLAVHRVDDDVVVEFEPSRSAHQPLQLAREMIGRIGAVEEVDRLVDVAADLVHRALGYDRVMIYRFEDDGAGKVVSEVKRADLESFLGQYFPASDIPQQARRLYLKNTIRVISDARFEPVPIRPDLDEAGNPLDLSQAHLRSVSPIHCEYLRNMGVSASMSISVILDGELWGLIACHHYAPRILPMAERAAAEMFGDFFALHLDTQRQRQRLAIAMAARASLDRFLRRASNHSDLEALFAENLGDFARLIPCDGVALWLGGKLHTLGTVPPEDAIPELAAHVGAVAEGRVWATHMLPHELPSSDRYVEAASGVLAIPLSQLPNDYLFFFRRERVQTLDWAGNPEKSYETGVHGDRLTPRKSFAIWKETVRAQSEPWSEAELETAEEARAATVEIVLRHSELLAEERRKSDLRQRMLNQELNHRVKNILAVIKSLVNQPLKDGQAIEDYAGKLKGRIQALSHAHDQVVRGDGGGHLADLLDAELSPYRANETAVRLNGPGVWLDGRAFSVLALVLHELATNAAKYGALSVAEGTVTVEWRLETDGTCRIDWTETGGPPVVKPSRDGFGSALIGRAIPYDLGGESRVVYDQSGVSAYLSIPARHVDVTEAGRRDEGSVAPRSSAPITLSSTTHVLLVEDHMLIALDVEAGLEDQGVESIVTAASASEALEKVRARLPDVAVLDVNLGEETSIPVAEELTRRGVPFLFATGYGDGSMIPSDFAAVPVVRKPYETDALITALSALLAPPAE